MKPAPHTRSGGFTLAEVAVTLVIVAMTLLLVMQALGSSKLIAAQGNNRKIATQLALLTIARVESGMFWEDLDGLTGSFTGTYAEEGYDAFSWELIIGDEEFADRERDQEESGYFDNYAHRRWRAAEDESFEDRAREDAYGQTGTTGGPFERVTVRVVFPKLTDQDNEYVIERWVPLEQVFGTNPDQPLPLDDEES